MDSWNKGLYLSSAQLEEASKPVHGQDSFNTACPCTPCTVTPTGQTCTMHTCIQMLLPGVHVSWAALANAPLPLPPGHSTGDIFRYTCICFAAILSKRQVSIYGRASGSANLIPLLLENLTRKTLAVSASASSLCSRRPARSKVRTAPDHLQVIARNPAKMWYTVQETPVLPFQNHFPKIQFILIQLKAINICWSAAKYSFRCWMTLLSANQYTTPSLFYLSYST